MSTISKLKKKLKHYIDPRTHLNAVKSAAKKSVAYHKRAFSAARNYHARAFAGVRDFHKRSFDGVRDFAKRATSRDNIKNIGRGLSRVMTKIGPYVAGVVTFVVSVFFTPVVGALLAAAFGGMGRYHGAAAARDKGAHGSEARQAGRRTRDRVWIAGAVGVTAGVATSAVVGAAAASAAAPAATAGAEAGAIAAEAAATAAAGGIGGVGAGAAAGATAGAAAAATAGGAGLLATVGAILSTTFSVGGAALPFVQQLFPQLFGAPKESQQRVTDMGYGSGGGAAGSAEGTGEVGAGGLMDEIAALPMPIKVGAAALGAGALWYAFKRKAA
jgi:hypothetical protein